MCICYAVSSLFCAHQHAKAIVFFNDKGGFFLTHSMPQFPDMSLNSFALAQNALIYGQVNCAIYLTVRLLCVITILYICLVSLQTMICLSLSAATLDAIAVNWQYYNPQVN